MKNICNCSAFRPACPHRHLMVWRAEPPTRDCPLAGRLRQGRDAGGRSRCRVLSTVGPARTSAAIARTGKRKSSVPSPYGLRLSPGTPFPPVCVLPRAFFQDPGLLRFSRQYFPGKLRPFDLGYGAVGGDVR